MSCLSWLTTALASIDANTIAAIAAAASAGFAAYAISRAELNRKNQTWHDHAVLTLERSFQALMSGDLSKAYPERDRLSWLTSARLILEYHDTKARLRDPVLLRSCESHEEHWRRQFFVKLEPLATHAGYYSAPPTSGEEIEARSAVIVHNFADWPDGRLDPIDQYPTVQKALTKRPVSRRWTSLHRYISKP